jgi:hypothetical protein
MRTQTHEHSSKPRTYKEGQRLYCQTCGSEIEVIVPCPGHAPGHVLRCCGHEMVLQVGHTVHMEAES